MAKLGKVLAGIGAAGGGFADGYMQGKDYLRREERQKAEDEERSIRLSNLKREASDRDELRRAGQDVEVVQGAGGATLPETMDNRDVGLPGEQAVQPGARVGGQQFATGEAATAAATAQNTPQAKLSRQAQVLQAQGKPTESLQLTNAAETQEETRRKRAQQIRDEGFEDAAKAMRLGDPKAVVESFNKTGSMKIDGELKVTPREIEIPGYGKVQSYDYSGTLVDKDGNRKEGTINSHSFSMGLMPYKDQLGALQKGVEGESKATYRLGQIENAALRAEAAGKAAEAAELRAEAARLRAQGGGDRSDAKEERAESRRRLDELGSGRARLSSKEDGGKPAGGKQATPLAMPKTKTELKAGQVYNTPRGPATWNGSVFELKAQ